MSTSSINNLANSYLQQLLAPIFQVRAVPQYRFEEREHDIVAAAGQRQLSRSPIDEFAAATAAVEPDRIQQVTSKSTTCKRGPERDQCGQHVSRNQLNTLASDFTSGHRSGQLPHFGLAQAIARRVAITITGHHATSPTRARIRAPAVQVVRRFTSSTGSSSTSSSSSPLDQLLAAFQSNATQNDSLNPLSIITNTLQRGNHRFE